jgi:MraZ protein
VKAVTRLLASRAADCVLDVQGRILLPPALRAAVSLEREAVVVGVLDRFEVWAPASWDTFLHESERVLDDVSLDIPWPLPVDSPPPGSPSAPGLPQGKPNR